MEKKETLVKGTKFNFLTILWEILPQITPYRRVLFKCDCGNTKEIRYSHVKLGYIKSCGCYLKDFPSAKTHGLTKTKEYSIWKDIKKRCFNSKAQNYKWYGAKGIKMSKKWVNSFETFLQDMGIAPTKNHTIDRIDSSKDYSKENCKWSTWKEQANNRTNSIFILFKNKNYTLPQLAELLKQNYQFIYRKYRNNTLENYLKKFY